MFLFLIIWTKNYFARPNHILQYQLDILLKYLIIYFFIYALAFSKDKNTPEGKRAVAPLNTHISDIIL